jgi:hypothetical protein
MAHTAINAMMDPEIFEPEIRLMRLDRLDEFLSCTMKEHECVGLHLAKMNRIHRHLTIKLEYEMMDDLAKSVVLHSLPPSYTRFVKRFLKRNEPANLDQLLGRIRLHEVEPI